MEEKEPVTVIFDLETDGLLHQMTKIHCLCIRIFETGEVFRFRHNENENTIWEGVQMILEADFVVGQNILHFDIPVLEKIFGPLDFKGKIRDTLVLSRVIFSDQKDKDFRLWERGLLPGKSIGGNRLEDWGYRLGLQKGEYSQIMAEKAKELGLKDPEEIRVFVWGSWNQDMDDYCELDVTVTTALWDKITERGLDQRAVYLEHRIHDIMGEQERNGWPFDVENAKKLAEELEQKAFALEEETKQHYGFWWAPAKKNITRPLWDASQGKIKRGAKTKKKQTIKKKGFYTPRPELGENTDRAVWANIVIPKKTIIYKDKPMNSKIAGAAYCPIKKLDFNPSSRHHIIDRFVTVYDWEPKDFTETEQPSVDDTVLNSLVGKIPMAKELAEIFYYHKRLGQVRDGKNGWLKMVDSNNLIHHYCNVGGTVTGRASHVGPNLAQVPRVVIKKVDDPENPGKKINKMFTGREGLHGWDCRRLFKVPDDYIMVGCDLEGIELRCLAQLLEPFDGGEYIDVVLNQDIHTYNQNVVGLDSRDKAKTMIYACVTMDSQALTSSGWKKYEEINVGDLVLTYNQEKNVKEWKPVLEKVKYNNAPVIELKNKTGFSIKSTPNHRWFIKQRRKYKDFRRPFMEPCVKTTEELNTESNIIVNAPLSENRELGKFNITKFNDTPKKETDWIQEVFKMTQTELQAFLAGFMVADGYYQSKSNKSGGWNWNQNIGNIQEAALIASYLINDGFIHVSTRTDTVNPMKVVHINSKQHVTMQTMQKIMHENQDVWCIKTENESWVVRQGDCITITGNTIYGAGDEKLGSIVNEFASIEEQTRLGAELRMKFLNNLKGFKQVMRLVKGWSKKGFVPGLDGRLVPVRSQHAALNSKLQSDAALIAKKWIVNYYDYLLDHGLECGWGNDFVFLAWIHDENQSACKPEHEALLKKLSVKAAADAGHYFNFKIPVAAKPKSGRNWAETH